MNCENLLNIVELIEHEIEPKGMYHFTMQVEVEVLHTQKSLRQEN